jgi:hypothetical protein
VSTSNASHVSTTILATMVAGRACRSVNIVHARESSKASGSGSEKGDCQSLDNDKGTRAAWLPYEALLGLSC